MSDNTVVIDLDAIEKAAKAAVADAPMARSGAFLQKTNDEPDAWMKLTYTPEAETDKYRLHSLWAWQEQERRHAPIMLELIRLARHHDNAQVLAVIDELSEQNRHLAAEAKTNATRHLEVATEPRLAKISLEAKIEGLPPVKHGDTVIVKSDDIHSREEATMLASLIRRISPPSTTVVFITSETEIEAIDESRMEGIGWVRAERAVGEGRTDVDTNALRQLLAALVGPDGYRIRELKALMMLPDSPIRVVVDQFIEKNGGEL